MAQPQQNINIAAPGFSGLNTQDSPLGLGLEWAGVADNCVIDRYGRIAARRGFQQTTTNPDILNDNPIVTLGQFTDEVGESYLFACGNNNIYLQQQEAPFELVPMVLPVSYVIDEDNWDFAQLNDVYYFVQRGQQPLKFVPAVSKTELVLWDEEPTDIPGSPQSGFPNCITAGFGRIWTGDFDDDKSVVTYSALLQGDNYTIDAGFFDLEAYWPNGFDRVIGLKAWNNYMVMFGERSILIYNISDSGPTTGASLADTIEGIGCIARDSIVPKGDDIMFADATGIRTLGRTIQEKSVPIGDLSYNVRNDFQFALEVEAQDDIKAVYHVEDSFYAVFLPSNPKTYVFDVRRMLDTGAARATQWVNITPRCAVRTRERTTYFGGLYGVYLYEGTEDAVRRTNAEEVTLTSINMSYVTHPQDFGAPSNLVFPKQVDVTVIGGRAVDLFLKWAYDYSNSFATKSKFLTSGELTYWNMSEWDTTGEYTQGDLLQTPRFNIWGSGRNVKIGLDVASAGGPFSIQEINIQALNGRIL
jgi:hypothetical protein